MLITHFRITWASSLRDLSVETHSLQWEALQWEHRMLGPGHRCSHFSKSWIINSAVCRCHRTDRPSTRPQLSHSNELMIQKPKNYSSGPSMTNLCTGCGT